MPSDLRTCVLDAEEDPCGSALPHRDDLDVLYGRFGKDTGRGTNVWGQVAELGLVGRVIHSLRASTPSGLDPGRCVIAIL